MADEYECDLCGATFDDEEDLHEHNREEHEAEMD
ncbi:C2H2-type zinc finger protein [Halorarum salinum]